MWWWPGPLTKLYRMAMKSVESDISYRVMVSFVLSAVKMPSVCSQDEKSAIVKMKHLP